MSGQSILVAGAGIAGLGVALAFGNSDYRITLIDRDPATPKGSPEEAFQSWERRGATQLRHSHVFLGRLTTLLRTRYPELLQELLDSGARIFGFEDGLPPTLRDSYRARSGDDNLAILFRPPHNPRTCHAPLCEPLAECDLPQWCRCAWGEC
ncbi:MAG: hypothetical protein WDM89_00255 [Rhizomicrobium sp.]